MSESVDPTPSPAAADDDYIPPPREKRKELDFDITPMIDVVFLLLIFFMVSSTMQEPAKSDAPQAVHGQRIEADGTIKVTLLPESGGVYEVELPGGEVIPLEEALEKDLITEAVAAAKAEDPGLTKAVLLADRDATFAQTRPILQQIGEVDGLSYHTEVKDPR
jgi:biopolymer transport protein ExbD